MCPFVSTGGTKLDIPTSPSAMMAPAHDSPQYEAFLQEKNAEVVERLKTLQDRCRVTPMEEQLARLHNIYIHIYTYIYIYIYTYIYINKHI